MASSQASEVVVNDDIRQSVRSIVMDLEANPWEVMTEQFDEEEYEQVIAVLLEVRAISMRRQVNELNDTRCLTRSKRHAISGRNV